MVRRRPGRRLAALWVAAAGGTAVMLVLPYLDFKMTEYHALSGARAASAVVKFVIGSTPVNLTGAGRLTGTPHLGVGAAPGRLNQTSQAGRLKHGRSLMSTRRLSLASARTAVSDSPRSKPQSRP